MWVGFIQSVENHRTTKQTFPRKRKFCQGFGLDLQHHLFPGFPAYWPALQIVDLTCLHNHELILK